MAGAMQGAAYLNGEFVPTSEAKVSIFDSGFIGGVSVFDTLACWQGGLFKLPQHRARFERSAHAAMIPLAVNGTELEQIIIETTRRSGCHDAYVQAIATRGRRPTPSVPSNEPTLIVYAIPYVSLWPEEKAESGISVMIPSIRQWSASTLDAKIKNFNRMHTHLARLEAERAAADDIVLLDDRGLLTESRGSNLFVVRGGALYTPRSGILEGITRQTVFEIAAELGISIHTVETHRTRIMDKLGLHGIAELVLSAVRLSLSGRLNDALYVGPTAPDTPCSTTRPSNGSMCNPSIRATPRASTTAN